MKMYARLITSTQSGAYNYSKTKEIHCWKGPNEKGRKRKKTLDKTMKNETQMKKIYKIQQFTLNWRIFRNVENAETQNNGTHHFKYIAVERNQQWTVKLFHYIGMRIKS